MARPERNTVDYFPFYCDEGKKMFYIEETYGNDGFATFGKILRELAKTEYHYLDLSKNTTTMFLSAKCKVSREVLESIINDLVDLGKFDENMWKNHRVIWCQDFIDSVQDAYKKRDNKCMTLEGLRLLLKGLDTPKPSLSLPEVPVKPQRKEKKRKEEKSIEETPAKISKSVEEKKKEFSTALAPFFPEYSKELLNDFYRYWSEQNKSGTKLKFELQNTWELKLRLATWKRNEEKFGSSKPKEEEKFISRAELAEKRRNDRK